MNPNNSSNLLINNNFFINHPNTIVDYCGISNIDDFNNFENIISFKYKIINTKRQFSKICDFISDMKNKLDYDWYIKIRPDIKLLEPINFDILSNNSINARARVYRGPKKIIHGMSVNGEGCWKFIGDCFYDDCESEIVLDDMFFIFHHNVINMGGFERIEPENAGCEEWNQTNIWKSRNINLNIIGIHLVNTKYDTFSGHINIK
jgi:hypothetical protein